MEHSLFITVMVDPPYLQNMTGIEMKIYAENEDYFIKARWWMNVLFAGVLDGVVIKSYGSGN
ncbi:CLUMA_CG011079, isoform A [Clunio marinus]|uniref:CLUMA_CG011079, isoform A n=1 Tax=Clunio marinus TaxID=568069 RepID=A0A1J1IBX1_9DIPT|nr:CLUMA_CG011079, isoform A [Clunio marinus]